MEERINNALQQIEADLQKLKSAREQVESVVSSHKELQGEVQTFVNEVANLSQGTEKLLGSISAEKGKTLQDYNDTLSALKNNCDAIVAQFKTDAQTQLDNANNSFDEKGNAIINGFEKSKKQIETSLTENLKRFQEKIESFSVSCNNITNSLQEKADNIISNFAKETEKINSSFRDEATNLKTQAERLVTLGNSLRDSIDIVNGLNSNIEKLMKELKDSQTAQDQELSQIKTDINKLDAALTAQQAAQNQEFSQIKTSLTQLNKTLNALQATQSNDFQQIKEAMEKQKEELASETKKNRKEVLAREKKQKKMKQILAFTIAAVLVVALAVGVILTFSGLAKKEDQSVYQATGYVLPDIAGVLPTVKGED